MDKELEKIVREAHSMGATESDLNQIVDTYKKKSITVTGSQDGFQPSLTGSKPFQTQVDTKVPSVLTTGGQELYNEQVKSYKPPVQKPIFDFSAIKKMPAPRDAYYQDPTIAAKEEKVKLKKLQSDYEAGKVDRNTFTQDLDLVAASGIDMLGRMASTIPSGILDNAIQSFGNQPGGLVSMGIDAEVLGKITEKNLGLPEEYNPLSPNNYLAETFRKKAEINQSLARKGYNGGITDALKLGEYKDAAKLLTLGFTESLPILLGLAATRGAGLSSTGSLIATGLGTQATTYQDLKAENPNIANNILFLNATLTGIGEAGSEVTGTNLLYNQARKLFVNGQKEQAKEIVTKGIKEYLDYAFQKSFIGSAVLGDVSGEVSNQIWKNATDKWSGVRPDVDYLDGVGDAALISAFTTSALAAGAKSLAAIVNPKTKDKVDESSLKISNLQKEADDPDMPPAARTVIVNQIGDLTESINEDLKKDNVQYNNLDDDQKRAVDDLSDKRDEIKLALNTATVSDETKQVLQKQLDDIDSQIESILPTEPITAQPTQEDAIITPEGFTNRVFESNMQLGEAPIDSHISEEGYNYRVLSQKEINAISESGGVFAREGKQKGGNKNTKYWTKGNNKNWYGDQDNLETIRVKQDSFKENEVVRAENVEVYNKETKKFEPLIKQKFSTTGNVISQQAKPKPKVEGVAEEGGKKEVKSDSDIEKRMSEIEGDSKFKEEFNSLETEMEKRERESVFNVPLSEVGKSVDALIQKDKDMPNGFGSFIEKRDASETKEVADRYLEASKLTDKELMQDFSDAVRGNPTTWYADGLKLRESIKEASKRGIDTKEMIDEVIKVYTESGYDIETAKNVVSNMLSPVLKGAKTKGVTEEGQQEEVKVSKVKQILSAIKGDISRLAGDSNLAKRIFIIEALTGKKVTKANAGINNLKEVVKNYVGITPDSVRGEYDQIKNWSEGKVTETPIPSKPIQELKQDVKKAKGKGGKTSALQTLKENSTPEDFKAFMDDNPVYQKYEVKAEPVVEQEITDTTEIELPAEKKSVSKDRLAELEKQKNELLKKIRKAGANLSSGFNPEVIGDLVKLGAIYVQQGIITFKDFATQLKKDYGKDIPEDIARDVFRKSAAVSGLGIRRTPERIGTGEGVSPILKEVANETNALYQKQDYKEIQDRLDNMSEADKNTLVGTLANVTGQLNAEGNVGVLAAIDLINMYEANGDKAGAQRVFDTISKSATAFAQLLRQYGQLKSSTPQGYVSIVTKYMKDKYNIDLNDAQKQEIEKLYNDAKKAIDINSDALNDLADNLTDPNYDGDLGYKVFGEATVLLEDANRKLSDYIDSLKPATAQSLFQKLTSIVQGSLLSLKSLLLNPVANAAQAGIKLSNNEVANLLDFVLNVALKTGRTKISGFDPLAIRLGSKAFVRGLAKANRMLVRGATDTDLAKIDVTGRLKPVEAWKSLYRSLRGKQSFEFIKTIEDLAEGTIGIPANLALRLLPYGDLPRNEQVKIAKLIEIGRNKFGLKGKELEAFTLRPDPESLAEAELEGDKSTLQEPNKVYTFLNNIINSIDSKADDKFVKGLLSGIKFVVRGTIVPFLKTPINYAAKAVRFTNPVIPYAQATYHMIKAIQAAKNIKNPILRESAIRKHQSKLTEYLGEAIIAQSIMSGALILIGYGLVTGDAPDDEKERNLMYQSLGPNMINISGLKRLLTGGDPAYKKGDTAIAYNALGILGAQLGISSNTLTTKEKENIRKQKFVTTEGKEFYKEDKGFYLSSIQAMSSNLPASLNFTLNQGFAQGTGTLLASIQDNQYSKWSNQMVKTLVTGLNVPNTVYQSLKAGNDYYRNVYTEDQVETWGNIIKERYGNIEDLPINYNMWGKPIKLTPEGSNPFVYHVLDIFRTQKILQDKNTYFVFDLYKKTGDKSVIPTSVKDIIDEEGGVYTKLTSAQKSELQRLVGEERAKYVDGKKSGALSMKNYDPKNDSEEYWAKQVEKLKDAYKLGMDIGKRRFEREVLSKTKK